MRKGVNSLCCSYTELTNNDVKLWPFYVLGSYNEKALPSALAKPFPVLRTITTHIKSALAT